MERPEQLSAFQVDLAVLAQLIQTIGRFDESEIPLTPEELPLARAFFTKWARELG